MKELRERLQETYYRKLNIPSGDLRISIVAGCNMRCTYCHNEGQGDFTSKRLSLAQVRGIVEQSLSFGVRKVRLTGGEPLTHPKVVEICRMLKYELGIANVGINTNGILKTKLFELCDERLADQIVVGLDRFGSSISKQSPIGVASSQILETVEQLHARGANVQIACVYEGEFADTLALVKWALDRGILIKVLEVSGDETGAEPTAPYREAVERLVDELGLEVGITFDTSEYYGRSPTGQKILFFHSHCRVRQCRECAHLHMRVTAEGRARPCILNDATEFDLLGEDFEHAMKMAINYLGVPPEAS